MTTNKRIAIVGLGGRHELYRDAILEQYAGTHSLVGLCDSNPGRLDLARRRVREASGIETAAYPDTRFEEMLTEQRPDQVIITSVDHTHDHYICRAMELGCDVITEKPMTIDAERCARILETQARTGKECRVTFNYRYSPPRTQIKKLLMDGIVGEVLSVDFHWLLDTKHGADYFRRWHRRKENAGGLMVHKATHHFDLVNWWLGTVPESVFARGHRRYYTPETATRLGLDKRAERCTGCPVSSDCLFFLDLAANESHKALYKDCEDHDGYYRDRCVFSEEIDIEDSMNLTVQYQNGVKMAYSLNAFMPWEGYTIAFNGSEGRLEHKCEETVYLSAYAAGRRRPQDGSVPGALKAEGTWIRMFPHFAPAYEIELWESHNRRAAAGPKGGHGGGDELIVADLFADTQTPDPYTRRAGHHAGAWSILTGIAANQSMAKARPVDVAEQLPDPSLLSSP